jgi:hypothetical protein
MELYLWLRTIDLCCSSASQCTARNLLEICRHNGWSPVPLCLHLHGLVDNTGAPSNVYRIFWFASFCKWVSRCITLTTSEYNGRILFRLNTVYRSIIRSKYLMFHASGTACRELFNNRHEILTLFLNNKEAQSKESKIKHTNVCKRRNISSGTVNCTRTNGQKWWTFCVRTAIKKDTQVSYRALKARGKWFVQGNCYFINKFLNLFKKKERSKCTSSRVLNSRGNTVLEAGSVSVLRWKGKHKEQ